MLQNRATLPLTIISETHCEAHKVPSPVGKVGQFDRSVKLTIHLHLAPTLTCGFYRNFYISFFIVCGTWIGYAVMPLF